MNKSLKRFSYRAVSVLLTLLLLVSTCAVGVVSSSAVETVRSGGTEGFRRITVVYPSQETPVCFWWGSDNALHKTETGSHTDNEESGISADTYSIGADAAGFVAAKPDTAAETDPRTDEACQVVPPMSLAETKEEHLFVDAAAAKDSLQVFAPPTLAVPAQSEAVTVAPSETATLFSFSSEWVGGSLKAFIRQMDVYEGENKIASLSDGDDCELTTDKLGAHTLSFAVSDGLGNVTKADAAYTVYVKTERDELTLASETPVKLTFGQTVAAPAVKDLDADDKVTYVSENEDIVRIDGSNLIGAGSGSTTVTATVAESNKYYEKSVSFTVEVAKANASDFIYLEKGGESIEMKYGEKYENPVVFKEGTPEGAKVNYDTSNGDVVTVDTLGTLTAVGVSAEPVTITVTVSDIPNMKNNLTFSYQVLVKKADPTIGGKDVVIAPLVSMPYSEGLTYDCTKNLNDVTGYNGISFSVAKQTALDGQTIENAAAVSKDGKLTAARSGIFTVQVKYTSEFFNDLVVEFKVKVDKAERGNFSYKEGELPKSMYVGCSFDIPAPGGITNAAYTIQNDDKAYASLDGNKLIAKKAKDGLKVTVSLEENDCYKAAETEVVIDLQYFVPTEKPLFVFKGEAAKDGDPAHFKSAVEVKPNSDYYEIALYNEDAEDYSSLVFGKSVTIAQNTKNPRVVLRYTKNDPGCEGAMTDVIDTGICVDKLAPTGKIEAKGAFQTTFENLLSQITFGLFTSDCSFTISAADGTSERFESGLAKTQYIVDYEQPEGVNRSVENLDAVAEEAWSSYNGTISVNDTNVHVVVYAKLTDNFGNHSYICTDGVVLNENILRPVVTFSDNDPKNGKYFTERTATVTYHVENFVPADGIIAITAKNAQGEDVETPAINWTVEGNVATATIQFTADAAYTFGFTDILGKKCVPEYGDSVCTNEFVVDNTAPQVTVTFDNNNAANGKYFKADRIASITVIDDNFKTGSDMMNITMKEPDGKDSQAPSLVWDEITRTGTVVFSKDGDYELKGSENFKDLAGNKAVITYADGTEAPHAFTIDKTAPTVLLSYNNNVQLNDGYFAEGRTATVTVSDNNFENKEEMLTITAKDADGNDIEAPKATWADGVATVVFGADAHYTFRVDESLCDLAGNPIKEVTVDAGTVFPYEFVVDTTPPKVTITFDNNKAANETYFNADRIATITVIDDNFKGIPGMMDITMKKPDGTDGGAPALDWDEVTGTGTVVFNKDGDYGFKDNEKFVDLAGNKAVITYEDGTVAYNAFTIDKTPPTVSVTFEGDSKVYNEHYYQHPRVAVIKVTDNNFCLANDMLQFSTKPEESVAPTVTAAGNTITVYFPGDADYTMSFTDKFRDMAGWQYVSDENTYSLCVDGTAPENLKIEYKYSREGVDGVFKSLVEMFTGGAARFSDDVRVKISAEDPHSRIEKITYSAPVKSRAKDLNRSIHKTEVPNSGEDKYKQSVEFTIAPEYEGQVRAAATNYAGLETSTEDGTIQVSTETPAISLEVLKNNKNLHYYGDKIYSNGDVAVRVTVTDTFFAPENVVVENQIDEKAPVRLDISGLEWVRKKKSNTYYADLPLQQEGLYALGAYYPNNFGRTAEAIDLGCIVIDRTAPQVKVTFDNNDVKNGKYFSKQRTATITVEDDNFLFFENSFVQYTIDDKGEKHDNENKMVALTTKDFEGNAFDASNEATPEVKISKDEQSATITFAGDAMYTFEKTNQFTDLAGNEAEWTYVDNPPSPNDFGVDKSAPVPLTIKYADSNNLSGAFCRLSRLFTGGIVVFNGEVEASIVAKDANSGINRVVYSAPVKSGTPEEGLSGVEENIVENTEPSGKTFAVSFNIPPEYRGKVEATAYNNAELYTNSDEGEIEIPEKKPVISLEVKNEDKPKVHDGISYYKENVVVRVKIDDVFFDPVGARKDSSGNRISNLTVKEKTGDKETAINATSGWKWEIEDRKAENRNNVRYRDFTLTEEGVKKLTVSYTNNAGISAKTEYLENFVIDKTVPVVTVSFKDEGKVHNGKYFDGAREATVTVADNFFVGDNSMLYIKRRMKNSTDTGNNAAVISEWKEGALTEAGVKTTVTTVKFGKQEEKEENKFNPDGYYNFEGTGAFVDLAGNPARVSYVKGTLAPNDFVVDTAAPNVLSVTAKEADTGQIFFEQNLNGVKKCSDDSHDALISLYAADETEVDGDLTITYDMILSDSVWETKTYEINHPIPLSPDRSFVVKATVTDKAGHVSTLTTKKVYLDTKAPEIDGLAPQIKLDVSSNPPKTDKDGNTLYNGNVVIDYTITDPVLNNSCSGLRENKLVYAVLKDGQQTQSGTLTGTKTYLGDRIQKQSGTITVLADLNNSNNVEVVVEAEDYANNPAKDSAKLRIDVTAPVINVSYSNNSPDSQYTEYFKADRTATIEIVERNFNGDKVTVTATKNGTSYVPALSWNHSGTPGTDSYTHTAEIYYGEDADYTFDIAYTDEAGNSANGVNYASGTVSPTKFTVDKTAPVVSVSFDNNDAKNGNYFDKQRTATITVTEHNFDADRAKVTATENNSDMSGVTWSSNGDTHTAVITFSKNAHYVMNITVTDKAGNECEKVKEEDFYVDTGKPVVKLTKIKNLSANKDEKIGFELTVTDDYLDMKADSRSFKLVRIDVKSTNRDVTELAELTSETNRLVYKVDNFEDDGIYTITCSFKDMAGNTTVTKEVLGEDGKAVGTDKIQFSVNRNGSTFMLDEESREKIDAYYVQRLDKDMTITEINADIIDKKAVVLTVNGGKPKALVSGETYNIEDNNEKNKDKNVSWKRYDYIIKKSTFENEAAYSLLITTIDVAGNESFSNINSPKYKDSRQAEVEFVVDRTIPDVVVNNLEGGGHYNVESKEVEIIANDDNRLQKVVLTLNGEQIAAYNEEQLDENGGKMSLTINSSESLQNLKIEAVDAAKNSTNDTEETEVKFVDFLITTNLFIQYVNNPALVISTIAGVTLLIALIAFLIYKKKKKG